MNKKVTAFVMAAALASPLIMAQISKADGGRGRTGTALSTSGSTSTGMESEYERRFVVPAAVTGGVAGRGEVEVEFTKRTRTSSTGVSTTSFRLEGEIEALLPGLPIIDPASINANIMVGSVACTFSGLAKTVVAPVLINTIQFTKVAIEGSSVQVLPALTPTDKGLLCTSDLSALTGTELVTVTGISGLGTTIPDPTPGNLNPEN